VTPNAPRKRLDRRDVPNALTVLRLLLTGVFVVVLSFYSHGHSAGGLALLAAILFTVAAVTDALDGYLARRWDAVSVFGRVMDPLADKVLVLGAFILLAGPGFASVMLDGSRVQVSGVAPWMAVVILARELLITSLRGMVESRGVSFAATWSGKAKMIAQSVVLPVILVLVWMHSREPDDAAWAPRVCAALALATTLLTAGSAIPYITRAMQVLRAPTSERTTK